MRKTKKKVSSSAALAAKIITRHRLGTHKYSAERLAWARKTFARRGGQTRAKMMTKDERLALSKKGSEASVIARRKRAQLLADLKTQVGNEKFTELLG